MTAVSPPAGVDPVAVADTEEPAAGGLATDPVAVEAGAPAGRAATAGTAAVIGSRRGATAATGRWPQWRAVAWVLGAAVVLCQVAYPLVGGTARARLTVATVVLFAAASVVHAALHRGVRWAAVLLVLTAGGGLAAEAVGVATGWPFGRYAYTGALGPRLLGVPAVIPLAWAMMAYPALLVGRRVARGPAGATAVGALALASWDVFLDPQMVRAGYWRWEAGGPALNGIPLVNHAGWLLVAVVLVAVLQFLPRPPGDDRLPYALYVWTYGSSLLANLAFFHRPAVALAGGLAMGVPTGLLVRKLWPG